MPGPRKPRKTSPASLERAALHHLQRYAATTSGLRRVLMRRVQRSAKAHGTDPAQGRIWIDALLERLVRSGLLDDARFAAVRAESLLRRGTSLRGIAAKLKAKGVAAPEVRGALAALRDEGADPDLAAARALARRRRIGPFAKAPGGDRQRELGILVRAGFSYSLAKKVLAEPA